MNSGPLTEVSTLRDLGVTYVIIIKGKDKGVPRQAEVAQGVPVG